MPIKQLGYLLEADAAEGTDSGKAFACGEQLFAMARHNWHRCKRSHCFIYNRSSETPGLSRQGLV
jgi:hypothetical protein